jgi:hypothetical protein
LEADVWSLNPVALNFGFRLVSMWHIDVV